MDIKSIKKENDGDLETDDSDSGLEEIKRKESMYETFKNKAGDLINEDDDEFYELLVNANIVPEWEVPHLHNITQLQRPLNTAAREEINRLDIPFRSGPFTPAEDATLELNWNDMCKQYNLPNRPEVFSRWRNNSNSKAYQKARRNALLYLGRNLQHRTVAQIFNRFQSFVGCTKKGRFTQEEKEIVELFVNIKGDVEGFTQSFLCGILGRHKQSLWRFLKQRREEVKHRIKWDLEITERFIKLLLKEVNRLHGRDDNCYDLGVLHGVKIPWGVWETVARKMETHPIQLKVQWISKTYVQLYVENPIYLKDLRVKLVDKILKEKYIYWQDIKWDEITEDFENYTSLFLWRRFYLLVKFHCPDLLKNVRDAAKFLHNRIVKDKYQLSNRRLRRLQLNKLGKLEFKD